MEELDDCELALSNKALCGSEFTRAIDVLKADKQYSSLDLTGNFICFSELQSILDILRINTTLEVLKLTDNPINNKSCYTEIRNILRDNKSLKSLHLDETKKYLTQLHWNNDKMTPDILDYILAALESDNITLTELILPENLRHHKRFEKIQSLLKRNERLSSLSSKDNMDMLDKIMKSQYWERTSVSKPSSIESMGNAVVGSLLRPIECIFKIAWQEPEYFCLSFFEDGVEKKARAICNAIKTGNIQQLKLIASEIINYLPSYKEMPLIETTISPDLVMSGF